MPKRSHVESSEQYINKNKLPGAVMQYLMSQGYVKTAMQLEQERQGFPFSFLQYRNQLH